MFRSKISDCATRNSDNALETSSNVLTYIQRIKNTALQKYAVA